MAKLGTIIYKGASNRQYTFDIWDYPMDFNEVAGIYTIGKFNRSANQVNTIYVGETDNLKQRFSNHHKQDCFDRNSADVLCWLGEDAASRRLAIEADLINSLRPICND